MVFLFFFVQIYSGLRDYCVPADGDGEGAGGRHGDRGDRRRVPLCCHLRTWGGARLLRLQCWRLVCFHKCLFDFHCLTFIFNCVWFYGVFLIIIFLMILNFCF